VVIELGQVISQSVFDLINSPGNLAISLCHRPFLTQLDKNNTTVAKNFKMFKSCYIVDIREPKSNSLHKVSDLSNKSKKKLF
jgi:hypothetical protein